MLDKVLTMFPPRFHKWQLAKFAEPAAWLNARLAFTRTAAVWSMVGHVVGKQQPAAVAHIRTGAKVLCLVGRHVTPEKTQSL